MSMYVLYDWLLVEQFNVSVDGFFYLADVYELVSGMAARTLTRTKFQRRECHYRLV